MNIGQQIHQQIESQTKTIGLGTMEYDSFNNVIRKNKYPATIEHKHKYSFALFLLSVICIRKRLKCCNTPINSPVAPINRNCAVKESNAIEITSRAGNANTRIQSLKSNGATIKKIAI